MFNQFLPHNSFNIILVLDHKIGLGGAGLVNVIKRRSASKAIDGTREKGYQISL
jgi:hypothetical protein